NSSDSRAANREVYVKWAAIACNNELTLFPSGDIPYAIDRNIATHLREHATKYDHQAEAKKDLADDFCFHLIYFLFLFWHSLASHCERSFLAVHLGSA